MLMKYHELIAPLASSPPSASITPPAPKYPHANSPSPPPPPQTPFPPPSPPLPPPPPPPPRPPPPNPPRQIPRQNPARSRAPDLPESEMHSQVHCAPQTDSGCLSIR